MLVLKADTAVVGEGLATISEFAVDEGQTVDFVLTYGASHLPLPAPVDVDEALAETEAFWHDWVSRCTVEGEWREPVRRSLITLKALTYRPTGGIVAAVTTSLPERIGGERNWDYRFCWVTSVNMVEIAV